jgi:hypothetical protein
MGEVMSAAKMTESAIMAESAMTTSKLVSTVTKSVMISVTETISTVVWMAEAVSAAVGVSGISTAVAVTAAWVTYVIAALSSSHANEERQSS